MIDIKLLRENPELIRAAIAKKKFSCELDELIRVDEERRAKLTLAESSRAKQKAANKEMASLPKGTPEFDGKLKEMKELATETKKLDKEAQDLESKWETLLLEVPNLPHESVPVGRNPGALKVSTSANRTQVAESVPLPRCYCLA